MPKKTKRQKILAAYHKQIKLVDQKTGPAVIKKETLTEEIHVETQQLPEQNRYFFSDLKKSLLLVAAVIALEIVLYYARLIK